MPDTGVVSNGDDCFQATRNSSYSANNVTLKKEIITFVKVDCKMKSQIVSILFSFGIL